MLKSSLKQFLTQIYLYPDGVKSISFTVEGGLIDARALFHKSIVLHSVKYYVTNFKCQD